MASNGDRGDAFNHTEARNIYLIGKSPGLNDRSKTGLKSAIPKGAAKQANKVEAA